MASRSPSHIRGGPFTTLNPENISCEIEMQRLTPFNALSHWVFTKRQLGADRAGNSQRAGFRVLSMRSFRRAGESRLTDVSIAVRVNLTSRFPREAIGWSCTAARNSTVKPSRYL